MGLGPAGPGQFRCQILRAGRQHFWGKLQHRQYNHLNLHYTAKVPTGAQNLPPLPDGDLADYLKERGNTVLLHTQGIISQATLPSARRG